MASTIAVRHGLSGTWYTNKQQITFSFDTTHNYMHTSNYMIVYLTTTPKNPQNFERADQKS